MTTLIASVLVLAPGLAASLVAYRPGDIGVATRLALAFALGFAVVGVVSFGLAIVHLLGPVPLAASLAVVTAGLAAAGIRRGSLGDHAQAIREEVREDPWSLAAGLLVILGIAIARTRFPSTLNFHASAPWRYWADGVEVADAHRIPAATLQYGVAHVPVVSKVLANTFNGAFAALLGRAPLPAMGALLSVTAVGLAVTIWALARELGLRLAAPLLPLLLVANVVFLNPELTGDLAAYRTENVGRLLAFAALAVGVRSIRDRGGWKEPVLAGALLATAAATHLVPVVVAVVLLGAYAAARAVIDRTLLPLLSRGAAILAVAGVLTVGALVAAGGDVGLEGVTGSIRGAGFTGSFDPTRYLATGTFDQRPHVSVGGWYDPPGRLTQAFVASALGVASGRGLQVLLFLGAVALAVVVLLWFPREVRALGVTALGLAGGLLAMTLYFSFRYDTYIPAETGVRRLFDYSSVPVVLAGLAVVEAGLLVIPRRRTAAIVGAALAVALALALLPRLHPGEAVEGARSEAVVASIVAHVPCGARLLPTLRTEGVIEAATGRVSVLEGATPYLRPDVLRDTMRLLLAARDFFQEPAAHRSFLSDQGIDYLLVPHVPLGGYRLWKSDEAAIRSLPGLEPVVDAPEGELYRVTTPPAAGRFPDPADFPGYDCVRP